ncbi:unnamed protein product [Pleuronectes platessa]|uniref:Uncharacterized protein n=1 Tax=Pleuronectes platessa TaxID=8262 RepID=A0A9N7YDN2_PLEPL|nr:unnamed protein product [Pleuronectes platessa]
MSMLNVLWGQTRTQPGDRQSSRRKTRSEGTDVAVIHRSMNLCCPNRGNKLHSCGSISSGSLLSPPLGRNQPCVQIEFKASLWDQAQSCKGSGGNFSSPPPHSAALPASLPSRSSSSRMGLERGLGGVIGRVGGPEMKRKLSLPNTEGPGFRCRFPFLRYLRIEKPAGESISAGP